MTPLSDKMRDLANRNPVRAADLRRAADELDSAVATAYSKDGTKADVRRMLGCWARARRLWCDMTGEPLV